MNSVVLRKQLHDFIEQADDDLLLEIYDLLKKSAAQQNKYDDSILKTLNQRVKEDEENQHKTYSKEETLNYIRSHKPES